MGAQRTGIKVTKTSKTLVSNYLRALSRYSAALGPLWVQSSIHTSGNADLLTFTYQNNKNPQTA